MPIVTVRLMEGRTVEQKRALARDITDVVVKHIKVGPEEVIVNFFDMPKYNIARGGALRSDT